MIDADVNMSGNKSAHIPPMGGKAIFKAGANTETVEFSSVAALREWEDELTWKHWPTELHCISIDYRPTASNPACAYRKLHPAVLVM